MAAGSRSTASPKADHPQGNSFPDLDDDLGLDPTREVHEVEEETHSSILGPDGEPIPYQSKKLGYMGFWKLKEQP